MKTSRRNFIKTAGLTAFSAGLIPGLSHSKTIFDLNPMGGLLRKSPESQGVSSAGIRKFLSEANAIGPQWHSFMFLRHGNVIAEGWWKPFEAKYKHTLYSLSKSFTSTAIGLLVKDGKISVDDKIVSFFQEEIPPSADENLKQMKIKNLLTMNTGHAEDTLPKMRDGNSNWTKTFLSLPVEHEPGTHFLYNTGATYMLGAVVKKVTGQTLEDFLRPRLFDPLTINGNDWEKSPEGLNVAGYGLRITTEDIAKFGQLYLQNGKWNGKEIVTEGWVKEATQYQTSSNTGDSDWSQGYGYQFWRCKPGFARGDGAFGQFCIIMPQHDAVLAVTSESWDMQKQMTAMWQNLLPAIQSSPLQESPSGWKQLKDDLANLQLPVEKGTVNSAPIKKYSSLKIKLSENEFAASDMEVKLTPGSGTLSFNSSKGKQVVAFEWEKWKVSENSANYLFAIPNRNPVPSKIAATGTWINDNTLQVNLKFVEAIHGDKMTVVFNDNNVSVSFLNSISENTKNNPEKRRVLGGTIGV